MWRTTDGRREGEGGGRRARGATKLSKPARVGRSAGEEARDRGRDEAKALAHADKDVLY